MLEGEEAAFMERIRQSDQYNDPVVKALKALDVGELRDSKGYNAVVMVVDCLSKWIHAIPTVTSLDSAGVARLFLEHVWCHHRLLEEVISNCRPAFMSNFSCELAALLGVKLTPSTSYHPQTDGQMECMNQEIEAYL